MAMTALPLAFIVPAEELPADDRTAQGAVWSTVASLLQSGLGRKFSKFYPQLRLEQQGGYAPFGVVLGRAAPPLFRELYRKALDRQAGAIMHHTLNTLSRLNPDQFFEEDGTIVCPAVIDGSDPDLMFHGLWHLAMQQGEILPDCGVYHVAQKAGVSLNRRKCSRRWRTPNVMPSAWSAWSRRRCRVMMRFDPEQFFRLLQQLPPSQPMSEPAEHSAYLQREVFDRLKNHELIDLTKLDWDAFDLSHVTPEDYEHRYKINQSNWLQGFNRMLQGIEPAALEKQVFF